MKKERCVVVQGVKLYLEEDKDGYTVVSTDGLLPEELASLLSMITPQQTASDKEYEKFCNSSREGKLRELFSHDLI